MILNTVALDYGLATCKMIGQSYMLHCRVIESQYKLNLASCLSHTVIQSFNPLGPILRHHVHHDYLN